MFGVDRIIALLINIIFDIRDAIDNGRELSLSSNVIKLEAVVSDDLPMDLRNEYCHSLEVVYATFIRNLLNSNSRSRFDSNPMSIFRSIPLLTAYDPVEFSKKIKGWKSTSDWVFSRTFNGQNTLNVFNESLLTHLDKAIEENRVIAMEDVILKESRGAVSTFVDIAFLVNGLMGTQTEKKFSVGVQVIPKAVPREEIVQFFVKQKLDMLTTTGGVATQSFWKKVKAVFTLRKKETQKELKTAPKEVQKTFYDSMVAIEGIKKPFVAILMSDSVVRACQDLGYEVINNNNAQKVYRKFPILSIAMYDVNSDTITASLTPDMQFVKRSAGEFNSEISQYEKELREVIRVNRMA